MSRKRFIHNNISGRDKRFYRDNISLNFKDSIDSRYQVNEKLNRKRD